MKLRLAFSALPLIAVFLLALPSCSDNSKMDDAKVIQKTDQSGAETAQKAEKAVKDQTRAVSSSIKGGQELKMDQFTLVIPGDWKKHQNLDVWCPAAESDSTTPPDHHLAQGARPPMMLNSSDLVEGIKTSIGADPQDLKLIKIGGMSGATCGWEKGKYQFVGLFLQEKIAGFDIPMLNFFILRAPKETFSQYEKTYWAILNSVSI